MKFDYGQVGIKHGRIGRLKPWAIISLLEKSQTSLLHKMYVALSYAFHTVFSTKLKDIWWLHIKLH